MQFFVSFFVSVIIAVYRLIELLLSPLLKCIATLITIKSWPKTPNTHIQAYIYIQVLEKENYKKKIIKKRSYHEEESNGRFVLYIYSSQPLMNPERNIHLYKYQSFNVVEENHQAQGSFYQFYFLVCCLSYKSLTHFYKETKNWLK